MDKLEIIKMNIVCIIAFASVWAVIFIKSARTKMLIYYEFDYMRKRNYKRFIRQKLIIAFAVTIAAVLIHTIAAYLAGFEYIDFAGVLLIWLAAVLINTTIDSMIFSDNVAGLLGSIAFLVFFALPGVVVMCAGKYNLSFDKYIGYMDMVLFIIDAISEYKYYKAWKKEDIK